MKRKKTILLLILFMLLGFVPFVKVNAEDKFNPNESWVNCKYSLGAVSITYYYNKTTNKFEETKNTIQGTSINSSVTKGYFINTSNELYCPDLYFEITYSGHSGIYNVSYKEQAGYNKTRPSNESKINNINNDTNNDVIKTCVYDDIIYTLNITKKQINSVNIPDYSVNSSLTFSQIYDENTGCKCISFSRNCTVQYSKICTINLSNSGPKICADPNSSTAQTEQNNKPDDKNENPTNSRVEELKNQFLGKTTCGGLIDEKGRVFFTFPAMVPKLTSLIYNLLKIAIPVILVIMGMLDLLKSASAQKEDEMKKAQRKFVQRLIAGVCALLVFIIVETVINLIATKTGNDNAMDCVNCFINGIDHCASVDSDGEANK